LIAVTYLAFKAVRRINQASSFLLPITNQNYFELL